MLLRKMEVGLAVSLTTHGHLWPQVWGPEGGETRGIYFTSEHRSCIAGEFSNRPEVWIHFVWSSFADWVWVLALTLNKFIAKVGLQLVTRRHSILYCYCITLSDARWTAGSLIHCNAINFAGSRDYFLYQPCNTTIIEGGSVEFNCTTIESTEQLATWVINGERHYWTDFRAKPEFIFNLSSNSLIIRNASRSLDGSTFQCIINRRTSSVAYLTVNTVTVLINTIALVTEDILIPILPTTVLMTPAPQTSGNSQIITGMHVDTYRVLYLGF